jgi:nitrate/nitrite transporter NarK
MQFLVVLVVAALFVKYFWLLVAVIAAIWAVIQARKAWRRYQAAVAAEERRIDEIRERADRQHHWVMVGDDRGTYGEFPAVPM